MDICLESFNPYAINEAEVINEGTNIFAKALEVLSKIWHKILDTITGFLDKFKKKKTKNVNNDTVAQFKKICKDKDITEINVPVIKNLGKMFKSHDNLMDWIDSVGEGLDFASKLIESSTGISTGGDGKFINHMSKWYRYFLKYTSTTGLDIKKDPESLVKIIKSAMITKDYDDDTIPISNENILSWSGTGYSLEQIFDDDAMTKLKDSITRYIALLNVLIHKLKFSIINVKNANRIDSVKSGLTVVLKTNQVVGIVVDKYIWSITTIRNKALTIMASSGVNDNKPENKNVSECFAYIR